MTEAVIVATARSPIGRASKGSLVDLRPDDMSAQIVRALMAKVPQVSAADVEDLIMGVGQPAGEAGFNIGRSLRVLAGLDDVPGVTVNRYCSSSLQTIRMAAHAIKAGEGDCFISAGVEAVSRYGTGASDTAPNPIFKPSGARTVQRSPGWSPRVDACGRPVARPLHRHGPNGRERGAARRCHPSRDGRVRGAQPAACVRQHREWFLGPTRSSRSRCPTAPWYRRRLPSRRHHGGRPRRAQARVPPRRLGHRWKLVPTQRRRRRGDGDERHESQGTRPHAAGPHRGIRRIRPQPRDHGSRPHRGSASGTQARRHDHRRHRPRRDQRGVCRTGHSFGQAPRHQLGQAQCQWRCRSRWVTRSA